MTQWKMLPPQFCALWTEYIDIVEEGFDKLPNDDPAHRKLANVTMKLILWCEKELDPNLRELEL